MADSEEARLKAERIKAMLAGYYGSQQQGTAAAAGATGAAAGGAPGVRPNLDSPAFDAQHHISTMLRGQPLEKLLVDHRSMAREIKALDSDMQQLVYENYNKFISATDTIRAMKGQVDGMSNDMERVQGVMGECHVHVGMGGPGCGSISCLGLRPTGKLTHNMERVQGVMGECHVGMGGCRVRESQLPWACSTGKLTHHMKRVRVSAMLAWAGTRCGKVSCPGLRPTGQLSHSMERAHGASALPAVTFWPRRCAVCRGPFAQSACRPW